MPMSPGSPDALLEGLDPEQRQVATALRGPVRVLAGAGTGKTRAVTHRIAYGVASGSTARPRSSRSPSPPGPRGRCAPGCGTSARTASRPAPSTPRRCGRPATSGRGCTAASCRSSSSPSCPWSGAAARRNRLATDSATLRDLAGEIEWAKVSNVRADDYPAVAEARGREVNGLDHAQVARVLATYEDVKRDQGRMDMEDVLLCAAAVLTEDDRVAAEVRRQYHHFVVDEFQDVSPIQWALLKLWLGGRDDLCVVGDPAQTIYSFAGASSRYLLDFAKEFPGDHQHRPGPQLPLHAPGGRGGQRRGRRGRRRWSPAAVPARRPVRRSRSRSIPTRSRRRRRSRQRSSGSSTTARPPARSRCSSGSTPSRRPSRRPSPRAASPTSCGEPSGSSSGPRCARPSRCCVGRRGRPTDGAAAGQELVEQVRGGRLRAGLDAAGADGPGQRPRPVGVVAGDQRPRRGLRRRSPGGEPRRLRRRPRPASRRAARAGGRGGHRRHPAHGQGAGVGRGVPVRPAGGHPPDQLRQGLPGGDRGGAPAVLRRRDPGPQPTVGLVVLARNPGGRGSRQARRASSTACGPRSPPTGTARERRSSSRAAKRSRCRVCHQDLSTVRERKVGRHEDCESAYDEQLFERLREWRAETAKSRVGPGVRRLHRPHPAGHRGGRADARRRSC